MVDFYEGENMDKIYITGHKNPDTDSICAALSYQELKKRTGEENVEAIRLGDVNRETQFVLDYFGVDAPTFKDSMKPQVKDLSIDVATCVSQNASLYKATNIMQEKNVASLPVIDIEERLLGVVSISDITKCYMEVWDDQILHHSETPVENIIDVLSANILNIPAEDRALSGKMVVGAMDPKQMAKYLEENDIVILGNREDSQIDAIDKNVSMIILTGGNKLSDELIEKAKQKDIIVISTEFQTYMAARLLPQSVPVNYVMTRDDVVNFSLTDTVEDVKNTMSKTRYRSYPVVDNQNKVVGNISRYHVINEEKKKLILVDHNERNQSVDDMECCDITEIIDHHRVANVATQNPVYFRNEPVGSTCTILSKMFLEKGIVPTRQTAGLLCSAIISDTLLFRSPTATETDRMILERMAKIANINPEEFAMEMFKAGTSLEGKSPADLLNTDVKTFNIESYTCRVAQIFSMDLDNLGKIKDSLLEEMNKIRNDKKEATFVLILTDIFREESEVLVSGMFQEQLAGAFDTKIDNNSFLAKGLLSRKKQMIPKLNQAVLKYIQEN